MRHFIWDGKTDTVLWTETKISLAQRLPSKNEPHVRMWEQSEQEYSNAAFKIKRNVYVWLFSSWVFVVQLHCIPSYLYAVWFTYYNAYIHFPTAIIRLHCHPVYVQIQKVNDARVQCIMYTIDTASETYSAFKSFSPLLSCSFVPCVFLSSSFVMFHVFRLIFLSHCFISVATGYSSHTFLCIHSQTSPQERQIVPLYTLNLRMSWRFPHTLIFFTPSDTCIIWWKTTRKETSLFPFLGSRKRFIMWSVK